MLVLCVVICAGSFSRHAGNMLSLCVYSEISMVPTNNVALATLKWICWLSKILLWGNFFIVFSWKTFWDFFWSRLATTFARSDSRAGHIFISSLFFFDKNVNEALAWIKREKNSFFNGLCQQSGVAYGNEKNYAGNVFSEFWKAYKQRQKVKTKVSWIKLGTPALSNK